MKVENSQPGECGSIKSYVNLYIKSSFEILSCQFPPFEKTRPLFRKYTTKQFDKNLFIFRFKLRQNISKNKVYLLGDSKKTAKNITKHQNEMHNPVENLPNKSPNIPRVLNV